MKGDRCVGSYQGSIPLSVLPSSEESRKTNTGPGYRTACMHVWVHVCMWCESQECFPALGQIGASFVNQDGLLLSELFTHF